MIFTLVFMLVCVQSVVDVDKGSTLADNRHTMYRPSPNKSAVLNREIDKALTKNSSHEKSTIHYRPSPSSNEFERVLPNLTRDHRTRHHKLHYQGREKHRTKTQLYKLLRHKRDDFLMTNKIARNFENQYKKLRYIQKFEKNIFEEETGHQTTPEPSEGILLPTQMERSKFVMDVTTIQMEITSKRSIESEKAENLFLSLKLTEKSNNSLLKNSTKKVFTVQSEIKHNEFQQNENRTSCPPNRLTKRSFPISNMELMQKPDRPGAGGILSAASITHKATDLAHPMNHKAVTLGREDMPSSGSSASPVYQDGNVENLRHDKNVVALHSKSRHELAFRLNASTQFPVNISAVNRQMELRLPRPRIASSSTASSSGQETSSAQDDDRDDDDDDNGGDGRQLATTTTTTTGVRRKHPIAFHEIFTNSHEWQPFTSRISNDQITPTTFNHFTDTSNQTNPVEDTNARRKADKKENEITFNDTAPKEKSTKRLRPVILNHMLLLEEDEEDKNHFTTQETSSANNNRQDETIDGQPLIKTTDNTGRVASTAKQTLQAPILKFDIVPKGDPMQLDGLNLSAGWFPFGYLGHFLSYLQPSDFPVELVKDAVWGDVSVTQLVLQSLQAEAGFIAVLGTGFVLSLFLPLGVLAYACGQLFRRSPHITVPPALPRDESLPGYNHIPFSDTEGSWSDHWRRRVLVLLMELALVMLSVGVTAMLITNEQLSSAIQRSTDVIDTVFDDIETYVRNSQMQMQFLLSNSIEQTADAIEKDLDDIQRLVGGPIQRELALETGVDVAQEALMDVSHVSQDVAAKVTELLEESQKALETARSGQIRMKDLRRHVEATIRQCTTKDIPLCGTLDPTRLEFIFKIDTLLTDHNLAHIRYLAEDNLTIAVQEAREEFQSIPVLIVRDTEATRREITRILTKHRDAIYNSLRVLDTTARDLTVTVAGSRTRTVAFVHGAAELEHWRWLIGLCAALAVMCIWSLLLISISCGCCGGESKAGIILHLAIFMLCVFSVGLWAIALSLFVIGGHGEVFVCKPLYDEPNYKTLSTFLDNPGLFYKTGGFLSNILHANDSINVPVRSVLRQCSRNQPTYTVFKLRRIYDIEAIINHHSWTDLYSELNRIQVNIEGLRLLTPDLQRHLQELLQASHVNLTNYRQRLAGPVTGKDLHSFANQLDSVASQITDLTTVSRMETLATRAQKLIDSHVHPLEQHKDRIVYLLTALEVKLQPLQRQVNQSLAHLRTIQYYVNNQGGVIADQKTKEYIGRLINYLDQFGKHVVQQLEYEIALCKPLWDIYDAARIFSCRHLMDPLNGYWFATMWCLLVFFLIAPVAIKLAIYYKQLAKRKSRLLEVLLSTPEVLNPSESMQNTWQTPEPAGKDGW